MQIWFSVSILRSPHYYSSSSSLSSLFHLCAIVKGPNTWKETDFAFCRFIYFIYSMCVAVYRFEWKKREEETTGANMGSTHLTLAVLIVAHDAQYSVKSLYYVHKILSLHMDDSVMSVAAWASAEKRRLYCTQIIVFLSAYSLATLFALSFFSIIPSIPSVINIRFASFSNFRRPMTTTTP